MNTICKSTLCATVLLLLAGGASAAPDAFGQSSGLIALNSLPQPARDPGDSHGGGCQGHPCRRGAKSRDG